MDPTLPGNIRLSWKGLPGTNTHYKNSSIAAKNVLQHWHQNTKLKLHDSMMLAIIVFAEATSYAVSPLATRLWQFYLASALGAFGLSKYSVVRSLLSKSISPDEVGKVFSLLAILAALAPVAGNPIFRQLYNKTMDTIPGSIFILGAALLFLAGVSNIFIFTQRSKLEYEPDSEDEKLKESERTEDDQNGQIFVIEASEHQTSF
jgi:MFS family permease